MKITLGSISMLHSSVWDQSDGTAAMEQRLNKALAGDIDTATLEHLHKTLPGSDIHLDSVTCALLAWHGVNPAIAAAMGEDANPLNLTGHGIEQAAMISAEGQARVLLDINGSNDGPLWHSFNVLANLPPIPETVIARFEPMRLRDIVSHPALDRLDLTALSIDNRGGTRFVIGGAKRVDGDGLAALLPRMP